MKKLLIVLTIGMASYSELNFASTCPNDSSIKVSGVINKLENQTDQGFILGVYNTDNELCDGFHVINAGSTIPNAGLGHLQVPVWLSIASRGKIYFSMQKSDLKNKLSKDDIKTLEAQGFKGFTVKGDAYYRIYGVTGKNSKQEYTGQEYTPAKR